MSWWRRRGTDPAPEQAAVVGEESVAEPGVVAGGGPVVAHSRIEGPNIQVTGDVAGGIRVETHVHRPAAVSRSAVRVDVVTGVGVDAVFTGRDTQIERLLAALDPGVAGEGAVVVSAGMGGVGKTALAGHCAAHAAAAGWFAGGVFSVDMLGYTPAPVQAEAVYSPLLRLLGVPGEQIPAEAAEAHVVYHQVLARLAKAGRRVLLVVDNVSTGGQARPLLPAPGSGHAVVVTTRDTLDLPARALPLDVLDQTQSVDLLGKALRALNPSDRRLVQDPDGAAELARACAGLPLALRVAAPLLAGEPDLPPGWLAAQLRATPGVEGYAFGEQAVAAVLDLSWHRLLDTHPDRARALRLLCLSPGPDISTEAAAALLDHPEATTRVLLRGLRHAHLLRPAGPDRWTLHDLVRAHTGTHTAGLDPHHLQEAQTRLLEHYITTTDHADAHLKALPGQPVPERFTGRDQALAWLDIERATLLAALAHAATTGRHTHTVRLGNALARYLDWRRHLTDWVTAATHAHTSATHLTPHYRAVTANNLGSALRQVRRFEEAIDAHQRARDLFQETGDRHGEGKAWTNLGLALQEVRRFGKAIDAHQRARDLFQETGDRHGEGKAWTNLGLALREVRRFEEAIDAHQHDLATCQELRDRHGEAMAWNNLGLALQEVGRFEEAIDAHQQARALYQETGDRHGEAMARNNLGLALQEVGRFEEAIDAHQRARDLYQQTGDRHREATAWNNLGLALQRVGQFEGAITAHQRARDLHQETGGRHGEAMARNNLGLALQEVGRFEEAIDAHQQARALHQQSGDRHGEGTAWTNLGLALREVGRVQETLRCWERARDAFIAAGDTNSAEPLDRVLRGLRNPPDEAAPV